MSLAPNQSPFPPPPPPVPRTALPNESLHDLRSEDQILFDDTLGAGSDVGWRFFARDLRNCPIYAWERHHGPFSLRRNRGVTAACLLLTAAAMVSPLFLGRMAGVILCHAVLFLCVLWTAVQERMMEARCRELCREGMLRDLLLAGWDPLFVISSYRIAVTDGLTHSVLGLCILVLTPYLLFLQPHPFFWKVTLVVNTLLFLLVATILIGRGISRGFGGLVVTQPSEIALYALKPGITANLISTSAHVLVLYAFVALVVLPLPVNFLTFTVLTVVSLFVVGVMGRRFRNLGRQEVTIILESFAVDPSCNPWEALQEWRAARQALPIPGVTPTPSPAPPPPS